MSIAEIECNVKSSVEAVLACAELSAKSASRLGPVEVRLWTALLTLGRKPLTRRLLAATSDVMHSARHAEGNDAGHTRGQEATKADKGRMA